MTIALIKETVDRGWETICKWDFVKRPFLRLAVYEKLDSVWEYQSVPIVKETIKIVRLYLEYGFIERKRATRLMAELEGTDYKYEVTVVMGREW